VTARAINRVLVRQLDALMRDKGLTKTELAKRMHTSRAQLDPENESVTLATLTRVVGRNSGWSWSRLRKWVKSDHWRHHIL
jgi:antitoxin HicB